MRHHHSVTVLFMAAAGPRLGFGHLMRCGVLAATLRVPPHVVLRANSTTRRAARALGWRVHPPMPTILRSLAPDLVVVDDPSPVYARRWIRAAEARQIPVAVIRDLGLHSANADLTIDGSLARAVDGPDADLQGPNFAILDRTIADLRGRAHARDNARVVIALGGGTHVRGIGVDVAAGIRALTSDVAIELAPGFGPSPLPALPDGCRWIDKHALRQALATATVAVVSGGITLYEACALGTPMVTVAVVDAQRVTTSAAAAEGAVVDASARNRSQAVRRAAAAVVDLVNAPERAARLGAAASRLVDGRGTDRVAAHIRALVLTHAARKARHAA